jgi:anthranilate phosphoribosyltransferase
MVSSKASHWTDAIKLAERSIDDGKAADALQKLVAASNTACS